ncbi:MAG: dihydroorotase [Alphaproteobacteria bacterium]|nr:dihydroorotase [Alphaproteobacteria bacterium]
MTTTPNKLTIIQPDDWHLHLRDGTTLSTVLPFTAAHYGRAIVMPNLTPPVTTTAEAIAYRERIIAAVPVDSDFEPLMTCYLTDHTDPNEVEKGFLEGVFTAVKLYPARATTNSDFGVTAWDNIRDVLARMEKIGMPLLVHGEEADPDIDIFDREGAFIDRVLSDWMTHDYPELKIVLEHITTKDGADFVREAGSNIGATVTPHHLVINRNDILTGGIRPHLYCLPIAKRETHRQALRQAVASGDPSFFLGTDSAPHSIGAKETDCGCAGIFNVPNAIEVYARVFEEMDALEHFEAFASFNGPNFYGLDANTGTLTLERVQQTIIGDIEIPGANDSIRPFLSGESLNWSVVGL